MISDGFVRLPRAADSHFTVPLVQFRALGEVFNIVEENLPRLVAERGPPGWDGDPATSGQAVKAQLYQSMVDRMMPQAYRGAFLVALWGLYESTVIMVADSVRRLDREVPPLPTGSGWFGKAKSYFRKELGFTLLPPQPSHLQAELRALQKIRHVFMHANGMKQMAKKEDWRFLEEYARRNPEVKLTSNFVAVSATFVRTSFDLVGQAMTYVTTNGRDKLAELGITDAGLPPEQPYRRKVLDLRRWVRYAKRRLRRR